LNRENQKAVQDVNSKIFFLHLAQLSSAEGAKTFQSCPSRLTTTGTSVVRKPADWVFTVGINNLLIGLILICIQRRQYEDGFQGFRTLDSEDDRTAKIMAVINMVIGAKLVPRIKANLFYFPQLII
jgi:hypothetical protein